MKLFMQEKTRSKEERLDRVITEDVLFGLYGED